MRSLKRGRRGLLRLYTDPAHSPGWTRQRPSSTPRGRRGRCPGKVSKDSFRLPRPGSARGRSGKVSKASFRHLVSYESSDTLPGHPSRSKDSFRHLGSYKASDTFLRTPSCGRLGRHARFLLICLGEPRASGNHRSTSFSARGLGGELPSPTCWPRKFGHPTMELSSVRSGPVAPGRPASVDVGAMPAEGVAAGQRGDENEGGLRSVLPLGREGDGAPQGCR